MVNEVRRQVEKEKEIAIMDTKKKKWVRIINYIRDLHAVELPLWDFSMAR